MPLSLIIEKGHINAGTNLKTGQLNFNLRVRDLSLCVGNAQLPKMWIHNKRKITQDNFRTARKLAQLKETPQQHLDCSP
jgi:hypothetical protein